jgi:hypothetical protein
MTNITHNEKYKYIKLTFKKIKKQSHPETLLFSSFFFF